MTWEMTVHLVAADDVFGGDYRSFHLFFPTWCLRWDLGSVPVNFPALTCLINDCQVTTVLLHRINQYDSIIKQDLSQGQDSSPDSALPITKKFLT